MSVGLSFGMIADGDRDGLKADLRKKQKRRIRGKALSVDIDSISHRHSLVYVRTNSQISRALLDSGDLPKILSSNMAKNAKYYSETN